MAKKDWKKVEDNIFKFEKVGDVVEGVLVAIEKGAIYGNDVYKIKQKDDKVTTVFSTTILSSRMSGIAIGDEVKIEYLGDAETSKAGQSPAKLFDVFTR